MTFRTILRLFFCMEGTQKTSTPLPSQPCAVYRHLHCIVCKEALMNFIIIWQLTVTRLSFIRTLLYQPRRHEISPNIATKFLKRRLAFPTRKRLDLIQTSGLAIAVHSCLSNNMNDGRLQSASELAFQAAANWLPWTDCKHYSWYDLYQWLYPAMNSFHRYFSSLCTRKQLNILSCSTYRKWDSSQTDTR